MGILINGKYYKNPEDAPKDASPVVGSQLQSYNLESQAQKHDMELIQPYLGDGSPNPDFITNTTKNSLAKFPPICLKKATKKRKLAQ